jgi:hypothetical protein
MLKASAPQNSTRRGSWCFVEVLDNRNPSHLLLDGKRHGRRGLQSLGGIGPVVVCRSEVESVCSTLIGQSICDVLIR